MDEGINCRVTYELPVPQGVPYWDAYDLLGAISKVRCQFHGANQFEVLDNSGCRTFVRMRSDYSVLEQVAADAVGLMKSLVTEPYRARVFDSPVFAGASWDYYD